MECDWEPDDTDSNQDYNRECVTGLQGWRELPSGVDRVISRAETPRTGRWLNPKIWVREIMEKLRVTPHSEPLTETWTNDFLSREGEGREVI